MKASEIAALVGGTLVGPDHEVTGVAALSEAGPDHLAFSQRPMPRTDAGVVLMKTPMVGTSVVQVADPKGAFLKVLAAWFPEEWAPQQHADATIAPSAGVHPTAWVGPGARIGAGCQVGSHSWIGPNVVLYPGTMVGDRCRLHAGVVVGADGFGFHPGQGGLLKVPHLGHVRIEDDVEIGANSTIDRGFLVDTVIGRGSKLDNQVHVAHNCDLGPGTIVAAQTGLSGGVTTGPGVMLGGQVGVTEHTHLGAGARVGAKSGVHRNVPDGETWLGSPAMPIRLTRRVWAAMKHLPEMWRES